MTNQDTHCHCGREFKTLASEYTTGYGTDKDGTKHCFVCCGERDKEDMIKTGKATLYLDMSKKQVTNWAASLIFPTFNIRKGQHNIARTQYNTWFVGPDQFVWHAVQYGENTQIAHCKRTKEKWTRGQQ